MTGGKVKLTKEKCAEIAKKYKRRNDWSENDASSYNTARNHGWLEELTPHMSDGNTRWCKAKVMASLNRFNDYSKFCRNSKGAYGFASKFGILEEIKAYYKTKRINDIFIKAKPYTNINVWKTKESEDYKDSKKLNCYVAATQHMYRITQKYNQKS